MARILVIEDNFDNLQLVRFMLERAGHTVLGAQDGRTGLELARNERPELILLDLGIPEIDGWQLASELKAGDATRAIRIVALTAHTLPGDRKKAFEAGCDGYISKPLDLATFVPQVEAYLQPD